MIVNDIKNPLICNQKLLGQFYPLVCLSYIVMRNLAEDVKMTFVKVATAQHLHRLCWEGVKLYLIVSDIICYLYRDLFINSGKEKPTGIVEIPIIVNINGFAKILDFVYTSQLCLSQSTVMQVRNMRCGVTTVYVVMLCGQAC